jgi:hypothetical protein
MNRLVLPNYKKRCYLEHSHEGVCRTYDGKPFTPNITHEDRIAQKMEDALTPDAPKLTDFRMPSTFRNNSLALALKKVVNLPRKARPT